MYILITEQKFQILSEKNFFSQEIGDYKILC